MNDLAVQTVSDVDSIRTRILTIRGVQVMLDRDLAELYGVPAERLNEQVKRNARRFPVSFMFQLTKAELEDWKSQIATSNLPVKSLGSSSFADQMFRSSTSIAANYYSLRQCDYGKEKGWRLKWKLATLELATFTHWQHSTTTSGRNASRSRRSTS